jgi:PHP family Zn ribbon phosphoesterase
LHRVETLADREEGYKPKNAIPFKRLLPLYEVISFAIGEGKLYSKKVEALERKLIEKFGNELNVLLEVSEEELSKFLKDEKLVKALMLNREGKIKVIPGYDGVYGKPVFDEEVEIKSQIPERKQKSIGEFL